MFRSTRIPTALRDLGEDIAFHAATLVHGAFDLTCVVMLALAVYATGLDGAPQVAAPANVAENTMAGPTRPCTAGLGAADPSSCITQTILKPSNS